MKRTILFSLLLTLLLVSCDRGQWWGDRLITKIEGDDKSVTEMKYNDEGKLISYYQSRIVEAYNEDTECYYDSLEVTYNMTINYTDTTVIMKGLMPYRNGDEKGYTQGEAIYKLYKNGLTPSCKITYDVIDTLTNEALVSRSFFRQKQNQLTEISNTEGRIINIDYTDNNVDYKLNNYNRFIVITTFTKYLEEKNKSCLILELERQIGWHTPAFYARILGRPSKQLVEKDVVDQGKQTVSDYSYSCNSEGYVTEYTRESASSIRTGISNGIFPQVMNLNQKKTTYTISYLD